MRAPVAAQGCECRPLLLKSLSLTSEVEIQRGGVVLDVDQPMLAQGCQHGRDCRSRFRIHD